MRSSDSRSGKHERGDTLRPIETDDEALAQRASAGASGPASIERARLDRAGSRTSRADERRPSVRPVPHRPSIAALLENLDALLTNAGRSTVVVAEVSPLGHLEPFTRAVYDEAVGRGMEALTVRLVPGPTGPGLVVSRCSRGEESASAAAQLTRSGAQREFMSWLENARSSYDLVVIEGPPLVSSTQAARLALDCDGLVLLATERGTSKRDLRLAIERVRVTDCHILGIVVDETREWLPRWLRGL